MKTAFKDVSLFAVYPVEGSKIAKFYFNISNKKYYYVTALFMLIFLIMIKRSILIKVKLALTEIKFKLDHIY